MDIAKDYFPFAVLGGISFAGALIIIIRGNVLRGRLAKLQIGLPGNLNSNIFFPKLSGSFEGLPFVVCLSTGSKNTPRKLNVRIENPFSFKLAVLKENSFSDFAKKLGISKDVQSGDAAFDAEFLLMSDDDFAVRSFLSDPAVKELIRSVFKMNYTVTFDNGGITASKSYYDPNADMDQVVVGKILRCLFGFWKKNTQS